VDENTGALIAFLAGMAGSIYLYFQASPVAALVLMIFTASVALGLKGNGDTGEPGIPVPDSGLSEDDKKMWR